MVDKIVVLSEVGLDRNKKEVQVGHSFNIKFKMKIVNDKLIILKMEGISTKLVLLMKSLQKQVEFGQKKQ